MSACDHPGSMALRTALVSGVALTLVIGLAEPADAAVFRPRAVAAVKKPNPEKDGFGEATKGVLQLVVSIGSQPVTLFSDALRVAQGPCSPAPPGHPPPPPRPTII